MKKLTRRLQQCEGAIRANSSYTSSLQITSKAGSRFIDAVWDGVAWNHRVESIAERIGAEMYHEIRTSRREIHMAQRV